MPKIVGSGLYNKLFFQERSADGFPQILLIFYNQDFHTGKDGLQNWKQSGKLSTNQCCLSDSLPSVPLLPWIFPVSRNGQSDGNIKVGLRIADAGRVYDSLRSGLVIDQPLKNRVLHELGIHQRSKIIFGEHFIHHLLPAARDAQGDTVIHKFLPLLVFTIGRDSSGRRTTED